MYVYSREREREREIHLHNNLLLTGLGNHMPVDSVKIINNV